MAAQLDDDDSTSILSLFDYLDRESDGSVDPVHPKTGPGTDPGRGFAEGPHNGGDLISGRGGPDNGSCGSPSFDDCDRAEGEGIGEGSPSATGEVHEGPHSDVDHLGDNEPEDLGEDADDGGWEALEGNLSSSVKTYGRIRLSKNGHSWLLECEPQVAIRLKRVFPKAKPSQKTIKLSATGEVSEELRWFFERYPMAMSPETKAKLDGLADDYLERQKQVFAILSSKEPRPTPPMALPPRDYQAVASEIVHTTGRLLVADEVGLGKTCVGLSLLARPGTLPAAIVVPTHLPRQWMREMEKFTPSLKPYLVKTTDPDKEKAAGNPDVWIVPYSRLAGWSSKLRTVVRSVIFDEAHELRRDVSAKYQAASEISSEVQYRLGLTATPVWNYGSEFYSVLGIVAPGELGDWDEFSREWCSSYVDRRKAQIADPVAFGAWLRDAGLLLRRTRKQVGRELPPLVRSVVDVEWNNDPFKEVEDAVVQLATKTLQAPGKEAFQAAGDLDARIRQATGLAKAPAVAALVRGIVEATGEPVVLFGWHRAVYDIWLRDLASLNPVLYSGTESEKEKDANIQKFIRGESKVLVMSLRSGQGVDGLQGIAHRVVFGELDWSPGVLEQCAGRVHRDGQEEPTMVYYPVCDEGSDPIMLDILDIKRWQHDGVVDPKGEKLLNVQTDPEHVKRLAREILKKRGILVQDPEAA